MSNGTYAILSMGGSGEDDCAAVILVQKKVNPTNAITAVEDRLHRQAESRHLKHV